MQIQMVILEEIDEPFSNQIQRWTNEVLEKAEIWGDIEEHVCFKFIDSRASTYSHVFGR